ncbi:MAG: PAS domain S-box protein [Planctomycetota bacterium]
MKEEVWKRRLERERAARTQAESFLESKSRELYFANRMLSQMADAWRYENEKNQAILDNAAEGIVTFDTEGKIATFNPAAEKIFGLASYLAVEKRFDSLFQDFEIGESFDIEEHLDQENLELKATHAQGQTLILSVGLSRAETDKAVSFIAVIHDRTKKCALESQLAVAQKMESVGQLAAGIAHEINTPIQYVGDNTRFLREAFDDITALLEVYERLLKAVEQEEDPQKIIAQIQQSAEEIDFEFLAEEIPKAAEQALAGTGRVAKIVKAMKEFSHPGTEKPVAVDINQVLETALTVSRNEYKYVAELNTDFAEELPDVSCFIGDLNQAFLNLIVNAAHAMEERGNGNDDYQGILNVATRRSGDNVQVVFRDNGCGMSEETKLKVFEPFFTTKPVGQGPELVKLGSPEQSVF